MNNSTTRASKSKKPVAQSDAQAQMSQAEVVKYLEAHPQFFVDNPALLNSMTVMPTRQGNVYDFTACQIAYLQDKNKQLLDKSTQLLELVQHNQQIITHTQEVVNACLSATSREVLTQCFRSAWQEPFDLPASVSLISVKKPPMVLERILTETRFESIYCGALSSEESEALFASESVASIVLSRFQYKKNQQVLLAIGSDNAQHFHSQLDTSAFRLVQSVFQYQFNRLPAA